ncbi:MAG TPA: L-dopachrome tautomerase-related protein [Chthoniobacterales bacterium]|nr:L-dopachrome tautomerase-related protein [Chthoniobacterales bacterium]
MIAALFIIPLLAVADLTGSDELKEVASFPDQQVTGVAVSKSGRVFVNFPRWADEHTISVAEIVDKKPKPFPDEKWNGDGPPGERFVCVQSVYADAQDNLWVLDPASPKMEGVQKGGAKLLKLDLKTNQAVQNIPFGEDVAPAKSYLNDVRVDTETNHAFITESGLGAIIVVDLKSGKARRLLDGHASTKAEKDLKLKIDGRELLTEQKETPQIHADGIALDPRTGYLYYHALTARTLYRIKTEHLRDENLSSAELEKNVENMGQTGPPDGMLESPDGSVYITSIEDKAIVRFDPDTRNLDRIIQDKRLSWPDSLAWGPDGELYVTASQIHHMPRFNNGKSTRTEPYKVFKVSLEAATDEPST